MNPFQYVTAGSPDEAVSLIGKNGRYLGGGIDLLDEMKEYIVSPDVLVNVKDMKPQGSMPTPHDINYGEVDPISNNVKSYVLGATVTVAEIAAHEELKKALQGLTEAASEVGSPQIRNVASLAGNLLQHSRCLYYRQPDIVCLKRGGNTCYALNGENKYSSLFSGCECITPFTSNLGVTLTALEAVPIVMGQGKLLPLSSMSGLYSETWKNPTAHNSLKASDFLAAVTVPTKRTRSAYRQVSEKNEFDWALVSCAAAANVTNGTITDARVVLGAVAPVPYMVEAANQFLEGRPLTDETASHAADLILRHAKPLAQNGYKVPLAHALIRRTLLALNP